MKYEKTRYPGVYKYKTSEGIRYRARVKFTINGVKKETTQSGFMSLNEAWAYAAETKTKASAGQASLFEGKDRTLEMAWNEYSEAKMAAESWNLSTIATNNYRMQPWLDKFGDTPISQITRNDLQRYISELYRTKKYSQETMRGYYHALMQVVNDEVDEGYLARNPFKKVTYRKPGWKPKAKTVDFETFQTFMKLSKEHMRPDLYRCLYLTTFGLRRGEVYGIRQVSIHYLDSGFAALTIDKSRTSSYPHGKSVKSIDSNRVVVVDELASSMLKQQVQFAKEVKESFDKILHQEDFIFVSPNSGNPYPIKALNNEMLRISQMINEDLRITPHMLRHMFASYASASGVDSLQLRKYVGHSDIDMTNHYTHSTIEGATEVMLKTEDYRRKYLEGK